MNKAVLIYSGGMDSTTLLFHLLARDVKVKALGFDYGQRHKKELESAASICQRMGVAFEVVDLAELSKLLPGSSQTDSRVDVPEGHYEEESMKKTVVPNRNMIMLSIAAGHAIALDYDTVAYAAHAGDHAIYPDCRPQFVNAMQHAFGRCDWKEIHLYAPYVLKEWDKGDICREGLELGVPFADTWTCYKGQDLHCGVCGSCRERKDAFLKHKLPDPTAYRG